VGDGQFHQVDLLAFQRLQPAVALDHQAVIAVGEVADDQGGGIETAAGRYAERIHVGHHAAVIGAGCELVDRFDVIVDLLDLDRDAVLVRPFLDDALLGRIGPGHPAHIDGPGDAEVLLLGGEGRSRHDGESGAEHGQDKSLGEMAQHFRPPVRSRVPFGLRRRGCTRPMAAPYPLQ